MEPQGKKQWWEDSPWIKVDEVTYQLKKDVEQLKRQGRLTFLDSFLSLVKAAGERGETVHKRGDPITPRRTEPTRGTAT